MLDKFIWKELLLLRSEIIGLFVNTLTFHGNFSLHNSENCPKESQMQLSQKAKIFSQFCIAKKMSLIA